MQWREDRQPVFLFPQVQFVAVLYFDRLWFVEPLWTSLKASGAEYVNILVYKGSEAQLIFLAETKGQHRVREVLCNDVDRLNFAEQWK